ncbi:MAG: hypothetical protein ACKO86_13960, partial [Dolichospermum sp.]
MDRVNYLIVNLHHFPVLSSTYISDKTPVLRASYPHIYGKLAVFMEKNAVFLVQHLMLPSFP